MLFSCLRDFPRSAGAKVLKLHPDLCVVPNVHFQLVQSARGRAFRIVDMARERKGAVVTWTQEAFSGSHVIHETTGVRANDVEGLDGLFTRPPQVDRPDGNVGKLVPCVLMTGNDRKLSRRAIRRQGTQGTDQHQAAILRAAPDRIEKDGQPCCQGKKPDDSTNDSRASLLEKSAPVSGRRQFVWFHTGSSSLTSVGSRDGDG